MGARSDQQTGCRSPDLATPGRIPARGRRFSWIFAGWSASPPLSCLACRLKGGGAGRILGMLHSAVRREHAASPPPPPSRGGLPPNGRASSLRVLPGRVSRSSREPGRPRLASAWPPSRLCISHPRAARISLPAAAARIAETASPHRWASSPKRAPLLMPPPTPPRGGGRGVHRGAPPPGAPLPGQLGAQLGGASFSGPGRPHPCPLRPTARVAACHAGAHASRWGCQLPQQPPARTTLRWQRSCKAARL